MSLRPIGRDFPLSCRRLANPIFCSVGARRVLGSSERQPVEEPAFFAREKPQSNTREESPNGIFTILHQPGGLEFDDPLLNRAA